MPDAVVTRGGIRRPDASTLAGWRQEFQAHHALRIPGFLDEGLLEWLRRELATATFVRRIHKEVEPPVEDVALGDPGLLAQVFALVNDDALFGVVRAITGGDRIGCFWPVVYRMEPAPGFTDAWHGDNDGNRLVAMSVNLGTPYEGGVLQIRGVQTKAILASLANTGAGDAVIFRISNALEHMVTPVTGEHPRLTLTGWFQKEPAALAELKHRIAR
jgi:hypothetical protein